MKLSKLQCTSNDSGVTLVEMMISVVLIGIVSIGLFQAALSIAIQIRRDKLVTDMMQYGQMVMNETVASLGGAYEVTTGTNSGGRSKERLEFRLQGARNFGADMLSRFSLLTEHTLSISQDNVRADFTRRWPPLETDKDLNKLSPVDVVIKEFSFGRYNDRGTVSASVQKNLFEILLVLEVQDESTKKVWSLQREFKRVVYAPNKEIEFRALQQSITQGGTGL